MPSWIFAALNEWAAAAGITSGPVLRPVLKGGLVGAGPVSWNSNGGVVTRPNFAFMSASEIVYTNGG